MSATLLVVEDNEEARRGLTSILQENGFTVVEAANGQEALVVLGSGPRPDLILLDMLMPVLDGWHFLDHLKKTPLQPPVPIILVTGTILTREWGQANGCQGFVHKPVEPKTLLEEVRRCLAPGLH